MFCINPLGVPRRHHRPGRAYDAPSPVIVSEAPNSDPSSPRLLRLPPDLSARIHRLATARDVPARELLINVVTAGLQDMESNQPPLSKMPP